VGHSHENKKRKQTMEGWKMTRSELHFIIGQFLLIDPSSERPRIAERRKRIAKKELVLRMEKFIQEFETLQVQMDLSLYKEGVAIVKDIKKKSEYEALIQEVVASFTPKRKKKPVTEKNNLIEKLEPRVSSKHRDILFEKLGIAPPLEAEILLEEESESPTLLKKGKDFLQRLQSSIFKRQKRSKNSQ
jgi:hypothetical protein